MNVSGVSVTPLTASAAIFFPSKSGRQVSSINMGSATQTRHDRNSNEGHSHSLLHQPQESRGFFISLKKGALERDSVPF